MTFNTGLVCPDRPLQAGGRPLTRRDNFVYGSGGEILAEADGGWTTLRALT